MPEKHAIFSPSKSAQWLLCPASIGLTQNIPDVQSDAAKSGTEKHTLLETALKGLSWSTSDDWTERTIKSMCQYVWTITGGANYWPECKLYVGQALDIPGEQGIDDDLLWGTADCVAVTRTSERHAWQLHVFDAKFGRHVVEPDCPQLRTYAIGALGMLERAGYAIGGIHLHIMQPFAPEPMRKVVLEPSLIRQHGDAVVRSVKFARDIMRLPLERQQELANPGASQCEWCRAAQAGKCPKRQAAMIAPGFEPPSAIVPPAAAQAGSFSMALPVAPASFTSLEMAYEYSRRVVKWADMIEKEFKNWLTANPTGSEMYEWVSKEGNREWKPGVTAMQLAELTGLQPHNLQTLVSVAELEKLVDLTENPRAKEIKQQLGSLVARKPASKSIKPKGDK